jgi:hypothetical protein
VAQETHGLLHQSQNNTESLLRELNNQNFRYEENEFLNERIIYF